MGTVAGSRHSDPARIGSVKIRSSAFLAMGPTWRNLADAPKAEGRRPVKGIRPDVGLRPAMPQKWAGRRMLPNPSVPKPSGDPPAAIMADSPPLLPPGVRERSEGLVGTP